METGTNVGLHKAGLKGKGQLSRTSESDGSDSTCPICGRICERAIARHKTFLDGKIGMKPNSDIDEKRSTK